MDESSKIDERQPETVEVDGKQATEKVLLPNRALAALDSGNRVQIEGYELFEVLGRGGAGVVFRAKHHLTGRLVAVKVLSSEAVTSTSYVRFQQEARALCKFNHNSVVTVYDFGMTASGLPYIIMEYLSGLTLAELIERKHQIPWDAAIRLFIQICDALEHAHGQGVIHRDLKPSNIMVLNPEEANPRLKILDFGVAKLTTNTQASMHLTATGQVFGSPLYMSPEQCSGSKVDKRTDIYSLGCVMYETLAGRPPHIGDNPFSVAVKHMQNTPESLSAVRSDLRLPGRLESIVLRTLEKDAGARYQSMGELRAELIDLTDQRLLRHLSRATRFARPQLTNIAKLGTAAFGVAVLLMMAIFLTGRERYVKGNAPPNLTQSPVAPEIALRPDKQTEKSVPSTVEQENRNLPRATPGDALRAQIASELPVTADDIKKAIAASAILPGDLPVQVTQSNGSAHAITIKTTRYQATQKDAEVDAIVVARKVLETDPKVSSLKVYFSYPGNPTAYDEVAFNQAQLKTLAGCDLKNPAVLQSIKVLVSSSAKKLEAPPSAGADAPIMQKPSAQTNASMMQKPSAQTNASMMQKPLAQTNASVMQQPLAQTSASTMLRPLAGTNAPVMLRPLAHANAPLMPRLWGQTDASMMPPSVGPANAPIMPLSVGPANAPVMPVPVPQVNAPIMPKPWGQPTATQVPSGYVKNYREYRAAAAGSTLAVLLPDRTPQYLDQLGQAFRQVGIAEPNLGEMQFRRLRLALHLISMRQNGQDIQAHKAAYASIESGFANTDSKEAFLLLRTEEQSLQVPSWKMSQDYLLVHNELRALKWPTY